MTRDYANIMVIGRTGVGKSSFLNYIIDKEKFKTGKGEPVTMHFDTLEFESVDGIPIRVYDSKGIEVKDLAIIKDETLDFIGKTCGDSDPMKWLHSIFYCVNLASARFELEEARFINDICRTISQTVHIVLTHCDAPDSEAVKKMEDHIKSLVFEFPAGELIGQ